jgi:malonyl-CoA/methylmalonyl-CoA synthetase
VAEVAVAGAPDPDLGERVVAWVVVEEGRTATAAELADHVANLLTRHKRPREVQFVSELPRNAMGKVLKRELPREETTKWSEFLPKPSAGRPPNP